MIVVRANQKLITSQGWGFFNEDILLIALESGSIKVHFGYIDNLERKSSEELNLPEIDYDDADQVYS